MVLTPKDGSFLMKHHKIGAGKCLFLHEKYFSANPKIVYKIY